VGRILNEAIVAYFTLLWHYLPRETGENYEESVMLVGSVSNVSEIRAESMPKKSWNIL
jgi:hypothetical protein